MIRVTFELSVFKLFPKRYLPEELIERFEELCKYLKDLLPKILRVHPKLEHNPGLVQRLSHFTDAYNKVEQYIANPDNMVQRFWHFVDSALQDDHELDGSVDSILLIPRLFCLFAWNHRVEIMEFVPKEKVGIYLKCFFRVGRNIRGSDYLIFFFTYDI